MQVLFVASSHGRAAQKQQHHSSRVFRRKAYRIKHDHDFLRRRRRTHKRTRAQTLKEAHCRPVLLPESFVEGAMTARTYTALNTIDKL